jgi:large subunit ribosomal protein L4
MHKIENYSLKGTKLTDLTLPAELTGEVNMSLLAQAIRVYEDTAHFGLRKAKTRAEVNRTTKKWYKQKGTGGARHGAKSAPIFVGGGVAPGPRPVDRRLNISNRLAKEAFKSAILLKIKENEVFALSGLDKIAKTKEASVVMNKLGKGKSIIVALAEANLAAKRYLKNMARVIVEPYRNLNAYSVFSSGVVILDGDVFGKEKNVKPVKKETAKKETKAVKKTVKVIKKTTKKEIKTK